MRIHSNLIPNLDLLTFTKIYISHIDNEYSNHQILLIVREFEALKALINYFVYVKKSTF